MFRIKVLLTGFIQIYGNLLPFLNGQLRSDDVAQLGRVLLSCVRIPIDGDMEAADTLSPVHSAAADAMLRTEEAVPKWGREVFQVLQSYLPAFS